MIEIDKPSWERFERDLRAYIAISRKGVSEILDKKGNSLRITIGKLFRKFKWKRVAFKELERRAKRMRGTLVRMRSFGKRTLPDVDKNGKPLNYWQQLVWQEVTRRQAGIGLLGVTFFNKRWRTRKGERYLQQNRSRSLGTLAAVTKKPDTFTIEGFTPGLEKVAMKRNILSTALAIESADIEKYMKRKAEEAMRKAFGNG